MGELGTQRIGHGRLCTRIAAWPQPACRGASPESSPTRTSVTWAVNQDNVSSYRTADRNEGKSLLRMVTDALKTNLPTELTEHNSFGRTLKHRSADVLASFALPGTSSGPALTINGRPEQLLESALGLRSLTHYIARLLLESGKFRTELHSR